jgi:hypothetical protein
MSRNHEELLKHGPHGNYTRGGQRMEKKGNDTDHLFFQSNINSEFVLKKRNGVKR